MIFQKRHNPLDKKGNTDFSLLSSFRIREGRKQARHIPTPANTALENRALALGTAWGRWDARQPSPEMWGLTTSGRETRLMNSKVFQKSAQTVVNKTRKRTAVGGGRWLPGNIAQSQVCLGLTPKQKSLRLPGESSLIEFGPCSSLGDLLTKSMNIPYITKKAACLV